MLCDCFNNHENVKKYVYQKTYLSLLEIDYQV